MALAGVGLAGDDEVLLAIDEAEAGELLDAGAIEPGLEDPAWRNMGPNSAPCALSHSAETLTSACAGGVFLASRIDVLHDFLTSTCLAVGSPEEGDLCGVQIPSWW